MSGRVANIVDKSARYMGFETPPGRLPDSPRVYVSGQVIARRGEPAIEYDSLTELFRAFGHNDPRKVTMFLVGSTLLNKVDSVGLPYFMPSGMVFPVIPSLRNLMIINAIAPLNHDNPQRYITDRIVYQAARMGQSHSSMPLIGRTALESLAGRSFVSWFGDTVGDKAPYVPSLLTVLLFRALYAHSEYGHLDAREATESGAVDHHLNTVRFPVYAGS